MNKIINYKNIQINVIEFNITQNINKYIEKYKINYIYFDTTNFKKYKLNRALAYNIIINIFRQYIFIFKYILFHTYEYTINYNIENILLLLENNDIIHIYDNNIKNNLLFQSIIINNEIFEKIEENYYFDSEIFFENNGYEIDFFVKKIKKLNNIKIYNLEINNNSNNNNVNIYSLMLPEINENKNKINMENYYESILNIFNC
jgi:hypothetical protein